MKDEYEQSLVTMNDSEFYRECYRTVRKSTAHRDDSKSEYHWKIDACWDAAVMRPLGDDIYNRAFRDFHAKINRKAALWLRTTQGKSLTR